MRDDKSRHKDIPDPYKYTEHLFERSKYYPIVLYFWAEWCQPCRAFGPLLEQTMARFPSQAELVKIDVDTQWALVDWNIKSLPSIVGLNGGQERIRMVDSIPASMIMDFLEHLTAKEI